MQIKWVASSRWLSGKSTPLYTCEKLNTVHDFLSSLFILERKEYYRRKADGTSTPDSEKVL